MRRPAAVLALALGLAACGEAPTGVSGPLDLSAEWLTTSPGAVGLDQGRVEGAIAHARGLPNLTSLLVVRRGRLAVEEYFNGHRAEQLADVRSVTKSLVATLTGIAVAEGLLPGINERIGGFLSADYGDAMSPTERAITVYDLLTMTGGWDWDESTTAGYNAWATAPDPVRALLARPLIHRPGTRFTYNSAAVHLLGVVLERATGRTVPQLAADYLFGPLGVQGVQWERLADGSVNGGSGVDLRPRDLAKLGALWLQDGDPGDGRILPSGWVRAGTSSRFALWEGGAPLSQQGYGYLWWIDRTAARTHFFAWGFGGQFVWVAPELDMVVVVTSNWRAAAVPPSRLSNNGLELIVQHVLPAAR